MQDLEQQTTGDVTPDPSGYLATSLLIVILVIFGLIVLALAISAT